jgi:hypothetical protein
MTPCPGSPLPVPLNAAEVFQVVALPARFGGGSGQVFGDDADAEVVGESVAVREHPEVPLSLSQRDAVVARLGYRRTGPWIEHAGGRSVASVTTGRVC